MEKYVALSVKPLWDKYQFVESIDSGAFGSVYKVKNTVDNKFYAMKVQKLKKILTRAPNNYSNEMVSIIREINTFKLSHPNITQFHESYFTYDDQFAIVTELADQCSDCKHNDPDYKRYNPSSQPKCHAQRFKS
ncbi:protein kinase domain containing protein [Stylonychia lemnae]|uniref:Protein kinase domain containing protein n=1 Tax=Stylonychia lemnae TaxID=5949 RepID=A0A078B6Q1_STYLE|nr:protein kinase domain containing protein [Stylonychia lemnae]|eukprot:CDW90220.1 protein kinase domain containing protein [Stylonychia lemnae]